MEPTDEQVSIVDLSRSTEDNILVNALAGTGKSTTLVMQMLAFRPKRQFEEPTTLSLAFNTRITNDMTEKLKEIHEETGVDVSHIEVRGLNSMGHRVWMRTIPKRVVLDKKKTVNILREVAKEFKGRDSDNLYDAFWDIRDAVGWAKISGYVPEGKYPQAKRLITQEAFYETLPEEYSPFCKSVVDHVLTTSIKAAYGGLIDYDDQIYMPTLFGGSFPRFPLVVIDEAQDLNAINHAMLEKLVRGRLFAAGDRWQSIYGFRGAVRGGMDILQAKFNMSQRKLTNTFRCPEAVVAIARERVPEYKSRKPGGKYEVLSKLYPKEIPDNAAIICRNNAPLFKTAFQLLRSGRSVTVAGSDIGPKILAIMSKLGEDEVSQERTLNLINDWLDQKLQKNKDQATVYDMAECMKVFARQGKTLGQAIAWGESLFTQQGSLTLLTGHKAKGLEWDVVYHLDPQLIKSGEDQEENLRYVIRTRAKQELYEVNGGAIIWE